MSEYPSAPHYGANYGEQHPSYLPPTYPNQYSQPDEGHMGQHQYAQNYDANMAAYGYNGAVPGFSAASLASGAPPLPIYQGWNQDPAPLPPYTAPQGVVQHTGYAPHPYHNYAQHYPSVPQHNYQQNMPHAKPYDEGEVSEGEYEQEYVAQPPPIDYSINQYGINGGNGYMDTAHRAVYARGQDPAPVQPVRSGIEYNYSQEAPQSRRQESGSYSPYAASPRDEVRDEHPVTTHHQKVTKPNHVPDRHINGTMQAQNNSVWNQNGVVNKSRSNSRVTETHAAKLHNSPATKNQPNSMKARSVQDSTTRDPAVQASVRTPSQQPAPVQASPIQNSKTVIYDKVESRKKAEGAILNLLPLDIRFANYIEEGIKESVVVSLFDGLGVPRTSSKVANDVSLPQKSSGDRESAAHISRALDKEDNEMRASSKPSISAPASKLDHISREAASSERLDNTSNGISSSPPTTAATIAANEKERTLKMKMDALRKSREERAQKAAAKNNAKPSNVTAPTTITTSELEKPKAAQVLKPSTSPSSSPLPELQQSQPRPVITKLPLQTTPVQQTPTIPGLFLASAAASPSPSITMNGLSHSSSFNQRKRPVAADFDAPATPFKRPFGHSQSDTPLVIDVSEEEEDDEDVAMDLDSQADQDSPVQPIRQMSDQRSTSLQNLPPLTNFPVRKPFTPPPASSAASTPPVYPPSRKATLGRPEVLQEKEMQIEELRKKIAEAEAAKAQKKAQQSASGTQTPRPINTDSNITPAINDDMAKKVEASIQMQNLIEIAEKKVNSDQKRLHEAQEIELEKALELKNQEAERKRLRREKIATDLPRVDKEVLEKQRKLEQLKAQMAEIEADVQKNLEDKQRMAEEMERLGQEAEDQLQAQKEKLRDLTNAASITAPSEPAHKTAIDPDAALSSLPSTTSAQRFQPVSIDAPEPIQYSENARLEREPSMPVRHDSPVVDAHDHHHNGTPLLGSLSGKQLGESKENITADKDLEAALQEAVRADADSHDLHGDDHEMDIEDSYAPDPDQLAPESVPSPIKEANRSPSYSPVLERAVPILSDRQSDADYEPPDAEPLVDATAQSPPFSPAPAEQMEVTEDADDLVIFPAESGSVVTDENETVEQSLPQQTNGSDPMLIEGVHANKFDQIQLFTPYESALKHFRAFRFHPDYNQQVPGGFRSLTYSHKINPNVELCPWEMGGACNDKTCEYQHFRNIGLLDDAVLSTLGSPDEFTGEQRKQFCDGLKEVLSGLRARKIKDFDIIAKEVVAHRARFLGDKSKVLMLEGTSI